MASRIITFSIAISFAILLQCGVEAAHHNGTRHVHRVKNSGNDSGNDAAQAPLSVGYVNGEGNEAPMTVGTDTAVADDAGLTNAINTGANTIQNAISNEGSKVADQINDAENKLMDLLKEAFDKIRKGRTPEIVGLQTEDAAREIANAIQDAAQEIQPSDEGLDRIASAIRTAGANVGLEFKQGADELVDALSPLINKVARDPFGGKYPVYDPNVRANHELIHTVNGVGDEVISAIDNAANIVANAVNPQAPVPVTPAVDPGFNQQFEYFPEVPQVDPDFNREKYVGIDPGFNAPDTHIITV